MMYVDFNKAAISYITVVSMKHIRCIAECAL